MSLIFRHALVAILFAVTVVAVADLFAWMISRPKPSAPKPLKVEMVCGYPSVPCRTSRNGRRIWRPVIQSTGGSGRFQDPVRS